MLLAYFINLAINNGAIDNAYLILYANIRFWLIFRANNMYVSGYLFCALH